MHSNSTIPAISSMFQTRTNKMPKTSHCGRESTCCSREGHGKQQLRSWRTKQMGDSRCDYLFVYYDKWNKQGRFNKTNNVCNNRYRECDVCVCVYLYRHMVGRVSIRSLVRTLRRKSHSKYSCYEKILSHSVHKYTERIYYLVHLLILFLYIFFATAF